MQQIQIPEPCHENWDAMIPNGQGRHCGKCCKTVVDFSEWETADIFDYLKNNRHVCGRIKPSQMTLQPGPAEWLQSIFRSSLSYAKKIAAIIVICFGLSSCGTQPATQQKTVAMVNTVPGPDSAKDSIREKILGMIAIPVADTPKAKKPDSTQVEEVIMGDIIAPPPTPPERPLTGVPVMTDTDDVHEQ